MKSYDSRAQTHNTRFEYSKRPAGNEFIHRAHVTARARSAGEEICWGAPLAFDKVRFRTQTARALRLFLALPVNGCAIVARDSALYF